MARMEHLCARLGLLCALVFLTCLTACGGGGGDTIKPVAFRIEQFVAEPSTVPSGGECTLRWTVTGATSLQLNEGIGDVTGKRSHVVRPTTRTVYILTASDGTKTLTRDVVVNISGAAGSPQITEFRATPASIRPGENTTLSWAVTGATSLTLNPGSVDVTTATSRVVAPTVSTQYTLVATNASGSATRNADVTVGGSPTSARIILLHHSTGGNVWAGGVQTALNQYNTNHSTRYRIDERAYPDAPYPWNNYPYDYWNLWVNPTPTVKPNADNPSIHPLSVLVGSYDVIVFKHCFPVSNIEANQGSADVASPVKSPQNYMRQYDALKAKLLTHQNTKFIVWTGAAQVQGSTTQEQAQRARTFFQWVKNTWDQPGDNIFVWDFYELETEGGLYLRDAYAASTTDAHPNAAFCRTVAPYFVNRLVDVIEGRGDTGSLTGK